MAAEPVVHMGDPASQGHPGHQHLSWEEGSRWVLGPGGQTSQEPQYEILLCPLKELS